MLEPREASKTQREPQRQGAATLAALEYLSTAFSSQFNFSRRTCMLTRFYKSLSAKLSRKTSDNRMAASGGSLRSFCYFCSLFSLLVAIVVADSSCELLHGAEQIKCRSFLFRSPLFGPLLLHRSCQEASDANP